jgi:pyridinium-3,5-bisthiocarboxylic acid mononucleotide nickel chelatase
MAAKLGLSILSTFLRYGLKKYSSTMRILFFDCFAGMSGDMAVGAMISAGMPIEHLQHELAKIHLHGYHLHSRTIERSMISAVKFDVALDHDHSHVHEHTHQDEHTHAHIHDHHSSHNHGHLNDGHHHPEHEEHTDEQHVHTHGLSYKEIRELFLHSQLSEITKQRAIAIFHEIAIAEAKIHNVMLEDVHFHEVGAIDSIVDIASVAIGLEFFGIEQCYSRPVPLGAGGTIKTAHGIMPIPTPATLEIMKGYATDLGPVHSEMTTPTGAGIIKALSSGELPAGTSMRPLATGFGAGTKEFREIPNLLRIIVADVDDQSYSQHFTQSDIVTQLTTTIDDMTPQMLAYVQERLIEGGALDAYYRPLLMKKGRPGHELIILAKPSSTDHLLSILAQETTTIGVRIEQISRRLHPREQAVINHPEFGEVLMKRIITGQGEERLEPEYDDMKRIARERGLPIREVYKRLLGR